MRPLRFGTRGSALARWQTDHVVGTLRAHQPAIDVQVVEIASEGDRRPDELLDRSEGTGLFTSALQDALWRREIDVAVHSLKDLPTSAPSELTLAAVPERGPVEDALCSRHSGGLAGLPRGARVGTCSTRRRAQLLMLRPDVEVVAVRGNVPTRLARVAAGDLDAVVLASAGLLRLGLDGRISETFAVQTMLPAPGQGALAVEARRVDAGLCRLLGVLDHAPSRIATKTERDLLAALGGGCAVPVGARALVAAGEVILDAGVFAADGRRAVRVRVSAATAEDAVGRTVRALAAAGARELLDCRETTAPGGVRA